MTRPQPPPNRLGLNLTTCRQLLARIGRRHDAAPGTTNRADGSLAAQASAEMAADQLLVMAQAAGEAKLQFERTAAEKKAIQKQADENLAAAIKQAQEPTRSSRRPAKAKPMPTTSLLWPSPQPKERLRKRLRPKVLSRWPRLRPKASKRNWKRPGAPLLKRRNRSEAPPFHRTASAWPRVATMGFSTPGARKTERHLRRIKPGRGRLPAWDSERQLRSSTQVQAALPPAGTCAHIGP